METRLVVLGVIALALVGLWGLLAWRTSRYRRVGAADLLSAPRTRGRSLVLAFSTPDCVPCRTVQKPALDELVRRFPDRVEVRDVDATTSPDLAKRFGIFAVPSTVVVNKDGHIVAINHVISGWEKLASQLRLNGDRPETGFRIGQD